ncbi:hypothetical protein L9F63_016416, partial [Diploptera punctata]
VLTLVTFLASSVQFHQMHETALAYIASAALQLQCFANVSRCIQSTAFDALSILQRSRVKCLTLFLSRCIWCGLCFSIVFLDFGNLANIGSRIVLGNHYTRLSKPVPSSNIFDMIEYVLVT